MQIAMGASSVVRTSEQDGNWVLPLHDWEVTQCRADFAFSLLLTGQEREASIRINRSFTVSRPDRAVVLLEVGRDWERLGSALGLFGLDALRATAYADGGLELVFHDGTRLEVPPDAEGFEAWEFVASTGLRIVSLPDGGLAVWREGDAGA